MLRQLFAALALLTGFAVSAEPAQAAQIAQSVESAQFVEQGHGCVLTHSMRADETRISGSLQLVDGPTPGPNFAASAPAVRLRVDRARE